MAKKKKQKLLCVTICEAKPNKLFTEEQRRSIRFLRYNEKIECAECGKKRKTMWTMLCQFKAVNFETDTLTEGQSHLPLTPVCDEHPLHPDWPKSEVKNGCE